MRYKSTKWKKWIIHSILYCCDNLGALPQAPHTPPQPPPEVDLPFAELSTMHISHLPYEPQLESDNIPSLENPRP